MYVWKVEGRVSDSGAVTDPSVSARGETPIACAEHWCENPLSGIGRLLEARASGHADARSKRVHVCLGVGLNVQRAKRGTVVGECPTQRPLEIVTQPDTESP